MLKDAEEFAEQDKLAKEKIDSKNSLESYIYSMKNSVEDPEKLANKLEDSEKKTIKEALKEAQEWLDKNASADKEAFEVQLKDLQAYEKIDFECVLINFSILIIAFVTLLSAKSIRTAEELEDLREDMDRMRIVMRMTTYKRKFINFCKL